MSFIIRLLLLCVFSVLVESFDEIDLEVESNAMFKLLRDMANQTKADTLNLPANASSIRENITDTFSCENRTYGYYADVDNDCQLFHVCLPTQMPSGRPVTYRYSFICPNETIFNQEVLTCTRPIDSIVCEDAPAYYDVNNEIGKVPNKTSEDTGPQNAETPAKQTEEKPTENVAPTNQRRKGDKRKQNLIIENLMKEVINDELKEKLQEFAMQHTEDIPDNILEMPESMAAVPEDKENVENIDNDYEERIALERRVGRKFGRGIFRFKSDV